MSEEIKRTITIEDDASQSLDNIGKAADDASKGLDNVAVSTDKFKKYASEFKNNLDDISEGFDQILPGSKGVVEGVTKIGKAFKALIMNPIGITITAIATAFGILFKAIQNNENAMDALKKAVKAFEPVAELFGKAIEGIAKGIAFVVEGIGNFITKLFGLKAATAESADEVEKLNAELERNKKITDETYTAYNNSYKKLSQFVNGLDKAVRSNKLADFLKGNLSNIEELSKGSEKFKSIMENIDVSNISQTISDLRASTFQISAELESGSREVAKYASKATESLSGIKQLEGIKLFDVKGAEEDAARLQEMYNRLKEGLHIPPAKGGTTLDEFKEIEKQLNESPKNIENGINDSVESIKKIFTDSATAAGVSASKIESDWGKLKSQFDSGVQSTDFKLKELKKNAQLYLNEIYRDAVDTPIDIEVNVDTEGVINKVEGVISALSTTKIPSIKVPIIEGGINIEDIDLSGIEDKFEELDEIPSETLDAITAKAEALQNALYDSLGWRLDAAREDSIGYYDILKEVEDTNWAFEQARLEAENATDEAIEEARKAHNARLEKLNKQALASVLNGVQASTAAIGDTLNNLIEAEEAGAENEKEAFERTKGLQKASAIVNMLSGVAAAISTAQQLGPIIGPIIGAANAASVIAVCMAQIKKINNTRFDGAGDSGTSAAMPAASTTANTYNPTYTANTTGKNNVDRLQSTIEDNSMKNVKVYVTESDISDSLNSKKVKVQESSF